jgi:hypothetical protein
MAAGIVGKTIEGRCIRSFSENNPTFHAERRFMHYLPPLLNSFCKSRERRPAIFRPTRPASI